MPLAPVDFRFLDGPGHGREQARQDQQNPAAEAAAGLAGIVVHVDRRTQGEILGCTIRVSGVAQPGCGGLRCGSLWRRQADGDKVCPADARPSLLPMRKDPRMNTVTLLLPPRRVLAADAALAGSVLATWLARGDVLAAAAAGRDTALRESFQLRRHERAGCRADASGRLL